MSAHHRAVRRHHRQESRGADGAADVDVKRVQILPVTPVPAHGDRGRPQAGCDPVLITTTSLTSADTGRVDGLVTVELRLRAAAGARLHPEHHDDGIGTTAEFRNHRRTAINCIGSSKSVLSGSSVVQNQSEKPTYRLTPREALRSVVSGRDAKGCVVVSRGARRRADAGRTAPPCQGHAGKRSPPSEERG